MTGVVTEGLGYRIILKKKKNNDSAISEKITGYGAAPNSEVAANGRCGLQRARLDRAEPPGPAPEVQN